MRKFVLIAAVAGLALLGLHFWSNPKAAPTAPSTAARDTAPPSAAPPTAAPPTAAPPSATASTGPYGGTEAARKAWEPIVQGFALAYPDTDGLTRRQWLANLRPYLQPDVTAALKPTELDQIPAGHYTGYRLLRAADQALTVRVTYQEGWSLVLDVAAESPSRYRIARLDLATEYDD